MNPGTQRKAVRIIIKYNQYNLRFFKIVDPRLPSNHHGGKTGSWKKSSIFTHMFNPWTDDSETAARIRWSGHVLAPHRRVRRNGWRVLTAVHRGGWNLPSRFLEKRGGYPRKQKAQAEFPNMRGDDFRPLRLQHRGRGYRKVWCVARFFCFVLQKVGVSGPSYDHGDLHQCRGSFSILDLRHCLRFKSLFILLLLLDQSMMMVMVISPRLVVMCGIQLDVFISRSLRGQGKRWQEESCTVCRTQGHRL